MSKYNIIYRITNLANLKTYIGCHQTDNLDDGYMGSGTILHKAFKKYGLNNFKRDILFYLDSPEEMFSKEAELVNEKFVKRLDTYNVQLGGKGFNTKGLLTVKDKNGNSFMVYKDDPRYLSGKLVGITKGKITVKDKEGNYLMVDKNDSRYLSGELIFMQTNKVVVKNKNNETFQIDKNDPRYLSGELEHFTKGMIQTKNKNGKCFFINKNDPRYLSGELVPLWTGRKLSENHKDKISKASKINSKGKGNSQYGTKWICKNGKVKKIKKEELDSYLESGWKLGRK